jgi:hypothetical protein
MPATATSVNVILTNPKSSGMKVKISSYERAKGKGQSYAESAINLFLSEMVSNSSPILRVPWVAAANWRL